VEKVRGCSIWRPFVLVFGDILPATAHGWLTDIAERHVDTTTSLLEQTVAAAAKDAATVKSDGTVRQPLPDGVTPRLLTTHVDARGSVTELFDVRWGWHPDPLLFAYTFTVRPGVVKGWGLHKQHEDRYVLLQGELELVLYDVRPNSPTVGLLSRIILTERDRRIINIPPLVWHADYNIGSQDALVLNFPTMPYDHADPDKWRLPIDTALIPHSFPGARGGG
jgi:dTDP-4-dehydrorhamnose 3,5-epimerase